MQAPQILVSGVYSGFPSKSREVPETPGLHENLMTVAIQPANFTKNRYRDILPYDSTRVKLDSENPLGGDFINGNYVPGYHKKVEYIVTQGPIRTTLDEFWAMVWENDVRVISMVTKTSEGGREKVYQYWPKAVGESGNFRAWVVTLTAEEDRGAYIARTLVMKDTVSSDERTIRHFQFVVWPDHGVPEETAPLISFRNEVRTALNDAGDCGPLVVHCSAGVGRTGAFIVADIQLEKYANERQIDIFHCLTILRQFRCKLVQMPQQYVFAHQVIVDAIVQMVCVAIGSIALM